MIIVRKNFHTGGTELVPKRWNLVSKQSIVFHVRGRMADVWFAWGSETVEVGAETIEIGAETVKFGAEMDNIFS